MTVSDRVGVALPQLAVRVVPPALQDPAVEDRAGVGVAGADRDRGSPGPEVDGREVVPHLVLAVADAARVAYPESAVAVVAPALDAAVVQKRAGVGASRADRGRRPSRPHLD